METEKKYKLTDESIAFCGKKLYRIEALKDFADVKKGDLGGFIETDHNLSHNGNCWVYDDAVVYGCSVVFGNFCFAVQRIWLLENRNFAA